MKKLTLLAFMVLFSLTVFSSNNESTKKESVEDEILLKPEGEKENSFSLITKETSNKDLNKNVTPIDETSTAKENIQGVAKGTTKGENSHNEKQCEGSYTIGISKIDCIKYMPHLKIWLA
jgi:hypothetical protein